VARTSTERRQSNTQSVELEAQLHVALDNMPGALVYTDEDLNIVICNERFKEMYPVPRELLQPGQPEVSSDRFASVWASALGSVR
jgi:PAS domain-containing protein